MSRIVDSIKFANFLKKNLSKNSNKFKINKINKLDINNKYIYQIKIFNSSFEKKLNNTEKLCEKYAKEYPNNYFALNNIGNIYKHNNKINLALKYFLKAKNNYKNSNEFFLKLISFKEKIKFFAYKLPKQKKIDISSLSSLKSLYVKFIIETYLLQLITISRPHFSEGFSNLKYLSEKLSIYLDETHNESIIRKIYKILKPYTKKKNLPKADYDNIFYNIGNCYQIKKK